MASTKKSSKEEEEGNKHKKKTRKEATQMASTTKSSKEEDEAKKHKKKTTKELKTSAKPTQLDSPKNKKKTSQELKTPTKPTQLDSPKNKNKTPEPLKNSPPPQQQQQQNDSKSSKPKKRNREEKDNEVGEDGSLCRFPMARIKRIMKSEDHDLGLGGDAVFLVNKATEMFLEKFCEDGYKWSVRDLKKSLNYNHLASVVSDKRRYDFLSDFVPEKLRADEALSRRKLVEKEQG